MNSSFEYQESLNSLHFTEEEKAAIARRAAEAARKQTRPARRPVRRIALIAAAAVLALAVGTAGATGILRSAAEVFSPPLWRGTRSDGDHRQDRLSRGRQRHGQRRHRHRRRRHGRCV